MLKLLTIVISLLLLFSNPLNVKANESYTLLNETFTNNNLDDWKIKWGNWRIEDGALTSELFGNNQPGRIEIGNDNWRNYKIEVDIDNISGIDEGIGFRYNNIYNTNYAVTLRHGTGLHRTPEAVLYKTQWQGSTENNTVLATYKPTSLINNHIYRITIEVIDTNIKAWINQELIFNFQDNDFRTKSGSISFSTWTGVLGYEKVQFDNVKVTAFTPQPFLDLPWDYKSLGKTFAETGLNPVSWFDHQYPLQNLCPPCEPPVMKYTGETTNDYYRSHNGYDYGLKDGVKLNTPVLAAASGIATFIAWQNSGGAGNVIKIDHGNGYQTWYEHLSSDGLVVSTPGTPQPVTKGQQIGKVGMTGNTNGPHIHFSVLSDSNSNSTFSDDYPFGMTDPLGWESSNPDPWTQWTNGSRNGASSYNLFLQTPIPQITSVPSTGGNLATESATISVPPGALNTSFNLSYKTGPFESISNEIKSIKPSFFLEAFLNNGNLITAFSQPLNIVIHYSLQDIFNIDEDSLKIYFFNTITGLWEPLTTSIDKINKTVSAQTSHLSHFALMGEVEDLVAPTTTATVTGEQGETGWYRSPVQIELTGQDNKGGVGLEYTLYTLNGNDWFQYKEPLIFENDGDYQITYQSYDKAENQEQRKTLNIHIDKTPPEAKIYFDDQTMKLVVIGVDDHQTTVTQENNNNHDNKENEDEDKNDQPDHKISQYKITDQAGNTLKINLKDFELDKEDRSLAYSMTFDSLKYNDQDIVSLPENQYSIKYEAEKKQIKLLQEFSLKDKVKIRIRYNSKLNKSEVFTVDDEKEKLKEIKDGLVILTLTTKNGDLDYSY